MSLFDLTVRGAFGAPAATRDVEEPPLCIYDFVRDSEDGEVHTLLTAGMSAQRMTVPREARDRARAELVLYAREVKPVYWSWLAWLAQFPFIDDTWLGFGHTVPWRPEVDDRGGGGEAPGIDAPMFPGSELTHFLFLETLVMADRRVFESVKIEGDPVNVLWVVPITAAEKELKARDGVGALLDLLEEKQHPWVFDGDRTSYL